MGILSWSLKEPSQAPQAAFVFADGSQLTPHELGYGLLRFSHEPARDLFATCFGDDGPATALPGGDLIAAQPFVAHLYLTALYVGSYLAYARAVLKAEDAIMTEVHSGLSKGLKELLEPDGTPFKATDQQNLRKVIDLFTQAVVDDIDEGADADPELVDPTPSNTAKLAVSVLDGAYRENDGPMFLVSSAPSLLPNFLRLQMLLADAPLTVLTLLSKRLKVRLVRREQP